MNLSLNNLIAKKYKSNSQIIRVLSEAWLNKQAYCPNCGTELNNCENNKPVSDFLCLNCNEEYELKSKNGNFGYKIVDGAHKTMMERLQCETNPNLFLLNYDSINLEVSNLCIIPKHYFTPAIIEKRKPLSPTARRAGWVGCNILLDNIPSAGKIYYIKSKIIRPKIEILSKWNKTLFLREQHKISSKGWILEILKCIDFLNKREFTLDEIYTFEDSLKIKYPDNKHIKDKIRQQLQILRNKGYLDFIARGKYKLT